MWPYPHQTYLHKHYVIFEDSDLIAYCSQLLLQNIYFLFVCFLTDNSQKTIKVLSSRTGLFYITHLSLNKSRWRCPQPCRKEISIHKDIFFSGRKGMFLPTFVCLSGFSSAAVQLLATPCRTTDQIIMKMLLCMHLWTRMNPLNFQQPSCMTLTCRAQNLKTVLGSYFHYG